MCMFYIISYYIILYRYKHIYKSHPTNATRRNPFSTLFLICSQKSQKVTKKHVFCIFSPSGGNFDIDAGDGRGDHLVPKSPKISQNQKRIVRTNIVYTS